MTALNVLLAILFICIGFLLYQPLMQAFDVSHHFPIPAADH